MALILNDENIAEYKSLWGSDTFIVPAGKSVVIETSPSGEEILNEEVPAGKEWEVIVQISIKETSI